MKLLTSSTGQRRRGVALILTVLFLVFVAVFLASYLFLAQGEYLAVTRSQSWNISLVLAEAGVEDGLAFINQLAGNYGVVTNFPAWAGSQGWQTLVSNPSNQVFYLPARSPDTNLGYYTVYVTNYVSGTNIGPEIVSTGTAKWNETDGPKLGKDNVMLSFKGNPTRKIFVKTIAHSQLGGGIIAYTGMDFMGNNVTVDSFDSTTNTHSIWQTNWLYHGKPYGVWDVSLSLDEHFPPSRTANVVVATDRGIINVGNAQVAGYAATGPGGSVEVGHNGSVGDLYWAFHNTGLQPGRTQDDMNRSFYSYNLPDPTIYGQTGWLPVPAVSVTTNLVDPAVFDTYNRVITNTPANTNLVFYAIDNLNKAKVLINASNVVLYLTNGMNISSQGQFDIAPEGDVQIWTTGDIATKGNGSINNLGKNAHALSIYDVAGHPVQLTFGGNGVGTGYIYAPSSDLQFGGSGGTYDVIGAIFCNYIKINGNYCFHFDESLHKNLPIDQFVIIAWQEIQ